MTASGMGMVYNYAYTPNMRLKSKSMNGKSMLEYSYDRNGNVLELKDLTGRRTNYKYDVSGRMEEVWDSGKLAAAYTYKPDSQIEGIRYGNGVTIEYSHDSDKNVAGIVAKTSEGLEILKHSYEYDNNGNQIKKEENGSVTQYIYDSLNRLSKVVYPDVEELFSYDFAGNRTFRKKGSTYISYSYDKRNRLLEKIEGSEQTSYSYDSNGNLLYETGRQGTTSYTYDCFNRTERVRKSNGDYIRNFYDPEGLRSKIEENDRTAWFVYSGRDIVAELDGEKLRAASVRGHELFMQSDESGEGYYYLNNVHGDVVGLVDGTGEVVNRYQYDAFGNIVESKENVHNRFRYAGEQFDQVTGQYYLRARYYNPVVGRFTQEDTYRGDGLNLYSYVDNNPVNFVDPSGNVCEQKYNLYKQFREQGMSPAKAKEQASLAMDGIKEHYSDIAKLRQRAGLPEYKYSPGSTGTVAKAHLPDVNKSYYGMNSTMATQGTRSPVGLPSNPIEYRRDLFNMLKEEGKFVDDIKIRHLGDAQFISHAEANALKRAYERQGPLGRVELYVDRPTCPSCQKYLNTLMDKYGITELKVFNLGKANPILDL